MSKDKTEQWWNEGTNVFTRDGDNMVCAPMTEERAEQIVREHNCHKELVAALKNICAAIYGDTHFRIGSDLAESLRDSEHLIAKAEGGEQ